MPNKFSVPLHARVNEVSNIVAAVGPFKLSLTFDPRILHVTSVHVDLGHPVNTWYQCFYVLNAGVGRGGCLIGDHSLPLLVAFSIYEVSVEDTLDFNHAVS